MINPQDNKVIWFLRALYFFLVVFYVFTIREHFSYIPTIHLLTYVRWTLMSAVWNSGLLIITTKWAQKWKFLSFLFYIPLIIITPILPLGGWLFAITYLLFMVTILVIYFPWRRNDSISAVS